MQMQMLDLYAFIMGNRIFRTTFCIFFQFLTIQTKWNLLTFIKLRWIDNKFFPFSTFTDCEKSLENVPSNVYESVCGPEIAEYLGNQRLSSNPQDYTTDKNYASISNGEYNQWFLFVFSSKFFGINAQRFNCRKNDSAIGAGWWLISRFWLQYFTSAVLGSVLFKEITLIS